MSAASERLQLTADGAAVVTESEGHALRWTARTVCGGVEVQLRVEVDEELTQLSLIECGADVADAWVRLESRWLRLASALRGVTLRGVTP